MNAEREPMFGISPRCFGCGACSSLLPAVFAVERSGCRVARQPQPPELGLAYAALLNCPASAIKASGGTAGRSADVAPAERAPLYEALSQIAESVRWTLADIPWDALDPATASPPLRLLVREMAFSEHATYSATQRFLQTYYDDVDFSAWLAVWFYEETRHPHALQRWLRALGESFDDDLVRKGRVSTPFMKSKVGTLITNVISELTAAHAYHAMATLSPEPVLAAIARNIAGDEARHASSFFLFARALIAREPDRTRATIDALKVLHVWLNDSGQVTHPINQMIQRLSAADQGSAVLDALDLDFDSVRRRVTRLIGTLLGVALAEPADVLPRVQGLVAEHHARA
jgi:ferredoxin